MTDIERRFMAEYLLEKAYARMCNNALEYLPYSHDDVIMAFLLDNSPFTPQETMRKILSHNIEQHYLKEHDEYGYAHLGGCYDCDMGNGEGGCTIPGYCLNDP